MQVNTFKGQGPYTLHTTLQTLSKKCRWEKCCSLEKLLQLWKKVVLCMEENCIFYGLIYSVRRPLAYFYAWLDGAQRTMHHIKNRTENEQSKWHSLTGKVAWDWLLVASSKPSSPTPVLRFSSSPCAVYIPFDLLILEHTLRAKFGIS